MNFDKDACLRLVGDVLEMSRAADTEVTLGGGRASLTRFAHGSIHQNVDEKLMSVRVRAAYHSPEGMRVAAASTTQTGRDALYDLLDRVRELAMQSDPAPHYRGLAHPGYFSSSSVVEHGPHFDSRTANSGPAFRANEVAKVTIPCAREGDLRASGHYRIRAGSIGDYGDMGIVALGNSDGLVSYFMATEVDFACTVETAAGGSSWCTGFSHLRGGLDIERLALRTIRRARASESPRPLGAGYHRVLLEPAAVAALFAFALPAFSSRAIREGRSYLSGREGTDVMHPMLSVAADPSHPDLRVRPFDGEGVWCRRVLLLDRGRHVGAIIGRTDTDDDWEVNGYGPAQPSSHDAIAQNIVVTGGHGTPAELQSRTRTGNLITRLWYNRYVNPREGRVTGMTRDGFFELSDGEIVGAWEHMRYNASVFDIFSHIVDASEPVRVGDMLVPAVVVDRFPLEQI